VGVHLRLWALPGAPPGPGAGCSAPAPPPPAAADAAGRAVIG
jgi:hypothetical protein